jgi:hypothetical protein
VHLVDASGVAASTVFVRRVMLLVGHGYFDGIAADVVEKRSLPAALSA